MIIVPLFRKTFHTIHIIEQSVTVIWCKSLIIGNQKNSKWKRHGEFDVYPLTVYVDFEESIHIGVKNIGLI